MIISIHQPNFFPFLPILSKIEASDIFIIMGYCQYEKNNWQNRFNIGKQWYTLSVNKGLDLIFQKLYLNVQKDWNKIKIKLPEFQKYLNLFDDCIYSNLFITNTLIIKRLRDLLKFKTKIVLDYATNLKGTERLVDLCKHYKATEYLSGPSGKHYLDFSLFEKENIKVTIQDQTNIPKISAVEYLEKNNVI